MHPSRGGRPYTHQEPDIYDDQPSSHLSDDTYRGNSPSNNYQDSRKDISMTPHRGQDDRMDSNFQHRDHRPSYNEEYKRYGRHEDHSRSPRREGRRRYNDRDREGYRSPPHSRSRSRSRSPYYGAPPSRTVILEGLAMNMTQEDVLNELQHDLKVQNLEEVRVIKDKKTGLSRQFAFAQFKAIENARAFLDRFYPAVHLYGPYDPTHSGDAERVNVRIAYSREKEEREQAGKNEDDWRCDVCHLANYSHRLLCFRCNAPKTRATVAGVIGVVTQANMSAFSGFATTGDSDVSPDNTASQFLLFRGLEPGVTEELLSKAVKKLYKDPVVADAQPTKKTKIASTSAEANFGAKEGSLRRVLLVRDRRTNDSWRYGFAEFASVDDAQAAMAKYNTSEKFTISSKPVLASYIHAGVFVPVLQAPSEDLARFTFSPLSNPAANLMYWDEGAFVSEMVCYQEDLSALAKAKQSVHAKLAAAAASEGLLGAIKDADGKTKKRKAEKDTAPTSKKVVAPHLQFWSNRHAELHGLPPKEFDEPEEDASESVKETKFIEATDEAPSSQSFADMNRKCCLLCSRQFKTEAEVNKHERVSQLHRDNMLNEELKLKALVKLAKVTTTQTDTDGSAYRDRAKERRQAFNQPKQPAAQHNKVVKESSAPKITKEEEGPPPPSKGAALLGKMGWTAGEGLGAQGTGRIETISTDLYAQGVGLGAQGGKVGDAVEEADRSTRGSYADFVMKAKDKAKERFESMG